MTRALNPIDGLIERNTIPDLMVLIPTDAHSWILEISAHPIHDGCTDKLTVDKSHALRGRATVLLDMNGLLQPSLVPFKDVSSVGLHRVNVTDAVAKKINATLEEAFRGDVTLKKDF